MFNIPQWGCHGVFRKCQGYFKLINAIYNPAQKCNLTLSICLDLELQTWNIMVMTSLSSPHGPPCVLVSVWGDFLPHPQMGFTFSLYFPRKWSLGGMNSDSFLNLELILYNQVFCCLTLECWLTHSIMQSHTMKRPLDTCRCTQKKGHTPLNLHTLFKAPWQWPWSVAAFLPFSEVLQYSFIPLVLVLKN